MYIYKPMQKIDGTFTKIFVKTIFIRPLKTMST